MKCSHSYSEALAYTRRIRKQVGYNSRGLDVSSLKFLGAGADKTVYMLPCKQHVLKIGGRMRGWTSREIEAWRTLRQRKHYLLEYMAPVQRWSLRYNFMVQTYCEPYDLDGSEIDKLEDLAEDFGIGDICTPNIGMLDGTLMIIDWGLLDMRKLHRSLRRDAKRMMS